MICGPSNSGKSTLARAISRKLDLPAVHLDQLRFHPRSDWVLKPKSEFDAAHDAAIAGDRWVMDGNYFGGIHSRLERATGIIQLSDWRIANFTRYLRRTLFEPNRPGSLEGGRDSLKWDLTRWILWDEPRKRVDRRALLMASGLPYVGARSMRELRACYLNWNLTFPD
jgi:adenylate kinase family enzyme